MGEIKKVKVKSFSDDDNEKRNYLPFDNYIDGV